MRMNANGAGIALICSRGILTRSLNEWRTSTTTLAAVSNHPFAFICSTLVTVKNKPRLDFSSIHNLDVAISLFRDMVRTEPHPSVVDFTKLLNSVLKMKHYSVALSMFDEMRERGVPVNNYTMNIAINCYCRLKRVDFGFAILCSFLKCGYEPSVSTFTTLLNGLFLEEKIAHGEKMFKNLFREKLCDDYTMNIAINCYCHLNRVGIGFAILGSFFKHGYEPDVSTFTTLLKGIFLEEKITEGEKMFKKLLREKLCDPDEVMCLTVINGLCKGGQTRKAHDLLKLLEKRSCKLDVYCYNAIIDSLCKDNMFDDALKLVSRMIEKGISPNSVTYCSMIQGLCNFGRWKEVKDLLNEMQDRKVTPSLLTYNILMNGLCKTGQIDEAFLVLSMVEDNGVNPDIITYNILIKGLCENGKLDTARDLFKELPCKGLKPNAETFIIIINSLCREKLAQEAKDLFMNMEKRGCLPNSVIYNVLVRGFLNRNDYYEAIPLLEEMTKRGFSPDSVTNYMLRQVS